MVYKKEHKTSQLGNGKLKSVSIAHKTKYTIKEELNLKA